MASAVLLTFVYSCGVFFLLVVIFLGSAWEGDGFDYELTYMCVWLLW